VLFFRHHFVTSFFLLSFVGSGIVAASAESFGTVLEV
jgi:hypothetical protein